MKKIRLITTFLSTFLIVFSLNAQNQEEQKQKSPEEVAIAETEKLQTELKLSPSQTFYIDSILQHNYSALFAEFENMKASGMQGGENYQKVRDKWIDKNLVAFKKVLDEQQYIGYLKLIGKGKEYKRGKDGLYYKKVTKR